MDDNPEKQESVTGFMRRWSRRKIDDKSGVDEDLLKEKESEKIISAEAVVEEHKVEDYKTDEDMLPLEQLTEESDFSDFLSPGVSESLRKQALRKLFHLPFMNIVDGLDDYAEDYSSFLPLGNIIPQEMKRIMAREKEQEERSGNHDKPLNDSVDVIREAKNDIHNNDVSESHISVNKTTQNHEDDHLDQKTGLLKNNIPDTKEKVEDETLK